MSKALKIISLVIGFVIVAAYVIRSITVRLSIPDETVAATGNAAAMIGVVIAAIVALLVVVWLISRIRIPARAVAPMQQPSPIPAPARAPARAPAPALARAPTSYGARKIIAAIALGLIVFASTLITFGRIELAVAIASILVVCGFNAYDKHDASLDNILGVVIASFVASALALLSVAAGAAIAGMVGANPPASLIVMWAVSIPAAMGVHMLICNGGVSHIHADVNMPSHKRGIVAAGIMLALIAIAIAVAVGVRFV